MIDTTNLLVEVPQVVYLTTVEQGPAGKDGAYVPIISPVSDDNILAGQAVYIKKSNNHLALADANFLVSSYVIGLATENITSTFTGALSFDKLTLVDWTLAIGQMTLTPGAIYFLNSSGTMSINSSDVINVTVMEALDFHTAKLLLNLPILL